MAQEQSKRKLRKTELLTGLDVRIEIERAIVAAGGVNALARAANTSVEPIIRARKGGAIRPSVLSMLGLRKREATYERIPGSEKQ